MLEEYFSALTGTPEDSEVEAKLVAAGIIGNFGVRSKVQFEGISQAWSAVSPINQVVNFRY